MYRALRPKLLRSGPMTGSRCSRLPPSSSAGIGLGPNGMAPNVTALATSMLPPESPQREVVAWAISRPDGGRGAGIVMPHFYRNWQEENLRKLILNAIVWSAKLDVPVEGVKTTLP